MNKIISVQPTKENREMAEKERDIAEAEYTLISGMRRYAEMVGKEKAEEFIKKNYPMTIF